MLLLQSQPERGVRASGAGAKALPYLQQFSFHCATCAFQTNLAAQKSVSQLSPLFSNDMQSGYRPPSQWTVRGGG